MDTYHGDGLNLYTYVGNNPIRYVDPSGHTTEKCKDGSVENDGLKSGINQLKPYTGVKEASQLLKKIGVPRSRRVEYLQSFDVRTIYLDRADDNTYGIRFHDYGKNAYPKGRYLYETFTPLSNREGAAIKKSWNNMTGLKQWKVENGTPIIKGKAAPQKENGHTYKGGVEQWFIYDTKFLTEP